MKYKKALRTITNPFQLSNYQNLYKKEKPLRADLFSFEQMNEYGKNLAKTHHISERQNKESLLSRLSDNEKTLNEVRKILMEAIRNDITISPAGEWLIDNFYLIEEHIRTITKHLPKRYKKGLPQLLDNKSLGLIRVHSIALEFISHSDGQLDLEQLSSFIKSYQSVSPLQLGELWAIPTMIRLSLIENIRRISIFIATDRIEKNIANYWIEKLLHVSAHDPKNLILLIGEMTKAGPPMTSAFVSEMHRQLLGKGFALALPLTCMEDILNENGSRSSDLIENDIQIQAVNQVSVSNSIGSLRLLNSINWRNFVEEHSLVEQTLRRDPSGVYSKMDFATRDNYRHTIEHISKRSKRTENEVAEIVLKLANESSEEKKLDSRKSHVGYYLVDSGISDLEKATNVHNSLYGLIKKQVYKNRLFIYLGSIFLITGGSSAFILTNRLEDGLSVFWVSLISILLTLCLSQLAVDLFNFFSTLLVKPSQLPSMDFSKKIPDAYRTLVVVPTMLTDSKTIKHLITDIEVRFLANNTNNLYFALLTDFNDSTEEKLPEDDTLLELLQKGIHELKKKYEKNGQDIFFLLHRSRSWNHAEGKWIGYERKRGKLGDLNNLLKLGENSKKTFSSTIGDISVLKGLKYVITLDSDTQLPRGAACKMIATMAHPLNHAVYSEKEQRVIQGYGILQPRVTVSLPESNSSFYSRMHGNEPGVDPYTRTTSDVYQDLFKEGSFIGKGIYDVAVFEQTLSEKFPENYILSHDLLEGCYVRSGLLNNVEVFEKYPMTYYSDMKRRARWVRGDWQIFLWFLPYVRSKNRFFEKNTLSALSRWKIFDNIRRSLVPLALTSLIILGWILLSDPLFWTILVSLIVIFPVFIAFFWDIFKKPDDLFWYHHLVMLKQKIGEIFSRILFSLICTPYEAFVNIMAISRVIWRMNISHKKLLEWGCSPSECVLGQNFSTLYYSYKLMWISPFMSTMTLVYLFVYAPITLFVAGPILLLWLFAPYISWQISMLSTKKKTLLSTNENIFLQKIARKTWAFFEYFIGPENNWLPPDNFQEHHANSKIANYTSPTNIGLSLLSNLSANDFGYISTRQFLERTSKTLNAVKRLEKYRGHLYNWYNIETLQPLHPKYISTVDSGNFAGHLLTLNQGIIEILDQKFLGNKMLCGLLDTVRVIKETIAQSDNHIVLEFTMILEAECCKEQTLHSMNDVLHRLKISYESTIKNLNNQVNIMASWWNKILLNQLEQAIEDFKILSPWLLKPPIPQKFETITHIDRNITRNELYQHITDLMPQLNELKNKNNTIEENQWIDLFKNSLIESQNALKAQIECIKKLSTECVNLCEMDWDFLYDESKHLTTIGYKVDERVCDPGYYDLLASEARLCIFVAIAQGKLPEEAWFAFGRLLTNVRGDLTLLSWSGSMFEYLMPILVMPTYENTLLDQTYKTVVKQQIEYGKRLHIPWGVSESGYNMVDTNSNYQYQAFGVPGLGLKRSLEQDLVIAPYATALSLMVDPKASCQNLEVLSNSGFEGSYGFYESIDYTTSRLSRNQKEAVVQSFMSHHQGMSLLSIGNLLLDQPMQRRFKADPQFQATLLLLQERIPKTSASFVHTTPIADFIPQLSGTDVRIIKTADTPIPEIQLLSNGRYHIMLTNSGGGYSRWKNIAVTRWREDFTCDNWGMFCYIKDLDTASYWSTTHQPTKVECNNYEAAFSQGRVDFHNSHNDIDTHTEIAISPEDDIEIRRLHVLNKLSVRRTIEITTYAEVVIASQASDIMQPTFSNLFVQTEILAKQNAIICSRRPRANNEHPPHMFHSMVLNGVKKEIEISYETDRMAFIGRGNTPENPKAMEESRPLSGSQGSVLDPIVSIRCKLVLEPDESVVLDLITGISDTRVGCERLIKKYQDRHHKNRVFELAWTHSQVILRQINATNKDENLFGRLASSIIFANSSMRTDPSTIIKNNKGQSNLWGYAVSGDLPIVLLQITSQKNIILVKQLIQAHKYWQLKGLQVDLIIWNEDYGGYRNDLHNEIHSLIPSDLVDRPGGVFVRPGDQIPDEDRILFQTVARIHISDINGSIVDNINQKSYKRLRIPYILKKSDYIPQKTLSRFQKNLLFSNELGGFSPNGYEYVITTDSKKRTPLPWANVIANPDFGTVITESGQAYTWAENAHEMRLTPWNNDIVSDSAGEVFYLRDEESGHFWSTTPLPRCGQSHYISRHGFGYSVFEHAEDGIFLEMTVYVDIEDSIKFTVLKISNKSGRLRNLSATGYTEWVLGDLRPKTAMHVITEVDTDTGAVFARNTYNTEFVDRIAFFDTDAKTKTITCDRTEFIGRNGSLKNPDAMSRLKLSGQIGSALDPCTAIQVPLVLANGEEHEIIFKLGLGKNMDHARNIVKKFSGNDAARQALEKVKNYWKDTISALQIETPDNSINILANGWLTYQTLCCRLWARSGYYQSGGAFGFRDQLQDSLSLLHAKPELARKQILLCAAHQFQEGDVQHWWHPPIGRGVRTRISDDYLWLPFVTYHYVIHTGDKQILDEKSTFLNSRLLNPGEESYYELPTISEQSATLYGHCVSAIKHGINFGDHGLPLIGTGDWNDGMDRVGHHGKGESVWLGFFLYDVLVKFITIAELYNDSDFASQCKTYAAQLAANIEKHAWDGKWYRRAYFDDGTPLGSASCTECQIDSISQSWSVLSGAGGMERSIVAMKSAENKLVNKSAGIIQLLDPPFDKANVDPGYIKGYVPGVRENGGQYTHAAVWLIMAFAKLGDSRRTWDLLQMINPLNHGSTDDKVSIYKAEPYVLAADVYGVAPHTGRGGWTWYTGSASWMYQLIIGSFLGLKLEGNRLKFEPCIPKEWKSFKVHYRYIDTIYHIVIEQKSTIGKTVVSVDGDVQDGQFMVLVNDKKEHHAVVKIFRRVG